MYEASITQRFVPEDDPAVGIREEPLQPGTRRRIFTITQIEDITIKLPDDLGAIRIAYDVGGEFMVIHVAEFEGDPELDGEILFSAEVSNAGE